MHSLEKAQQAVKKLKIFPLPPVVLLPGAAMPLHVFEPRYRAMVRDALASDGIIALAQVMPGQESLLAGTPAIEEMVCLGSIGLNEMLDDGRYNVVLIGLARARITRELPQTQLYREAEAELLEDEVLPSEADVGLRQAVLELVARVPLAVGQRLGQVAARFSGGALADVIASTFMQDAAQWWSVLCETDVRARIELVTEELLLLVGHLKPRKPEGLMN